MGEWTPAAVISALGLGFGILVTLVGGIIAFVILRNDAKHHHAQFEEFRRTQEARQAQEAANALAFRDEVRERQERMTERVQAQSEWIASLAAAASLKADEHSMEHRIMQHITQQAAGDAVRRRE